MPILPEYEQIEKRSDSERIKLICKWSHWFYDHTDSFEGELGMQLAYLWAAMAQGTKIEETDDAKLVTVLRREKVEPEEVIWEYIDVVE